MLLKICNINVQVIPKRNAWTIKTKKLKTVFLNFGDMIFIKWHFPTSKIEVTRKVVFAYCDSPNVNSPLGCSPNRRGSWWHLMRKWAVSSICAIWGRYPGPAQPPSPVGGGRGLGSFYGDNVDNKCEEDQIHILTTHPVCDVEMKHFPSAVVL